MYVLFYIYCEALSHLSKLKLKSPFFHRYISKVKPSVLEITKPLLLALLHVSLAAFRFGPARSIDAGTANDYDTLFQERDPIERVRTLILAHDVAKLKELKDTEKEVRKSIKLLLKPRRESNA